MKTGVLQLHASRYCALAVISLAVFASYLVSQLSLSLPIQLAVMTTIILYSLCVLYRYALLKHAKSAVSIQPLGKGQYALTTRDKQILLACLQSDSLVMPRFALLRLRDEKTRKYYKVVIFPDSCAPAAYRQFFIHYRFDNHS
jgi:hypothetical protein